jgi:NADH-quinone oxidoreductase subunit E
MDLNNTSLEKIDQLIARYPHPRSAVLPLLHLFQEEKGHISNEAVTWIANKLNLQPINVYELITFYPMLRREPVGRKHIKVCRTLSCALKGAYKVCETLQTTLNCPLNTTTPDGEYTVEFVECLASCHTAPVVQVNQTLYENVTPETAEQFAQKLTSQSL